MPKFELKRNVTPGPSSPPIPRTLDISSLESWLWEAACIIRGPVDAPKFKDYILPLIFLKRLSDVFDDELANLARDLELDLAEAEQLAADDHSVVRLYIPPPARWAALKERSTGLGQELTDAARAVARENPRLQGVVDVIDFNATAAGQRLIDDTRLAALVQILSQHRLGLADVEPDLLGRAYEYLLRKFAEGQGQSAGEFYTPREVGVLIARLLEPEPGQTVYDPCCGSGGLLIKCHLRLLETHGQPVRACPERSEGASRQLPNEVAPLRLYGQEINPATFALARMNASIHDMDAEIAIGDTMRRPAFRQPDGQLRRFDLLATNPMWNQKFATESYQNDPFNRFTFGSPPGASADWGWLQHLHASLDDGGRLAVVLDTGAVSRGSGDQGSNRERDIRRAFVAGDVVTKGDLVEAVVLLPENLFYNTTAPGIIMVVNRRKRHPGEILLVNASSLCAKGRPKNFLTEEHVAQIARLYHEWRAEPGISAVIATADAARNDFNLSPSRYVASTDQQEVLPLEEAVVLLQEAEEERALADRELDEVLRLLGVGGLRSV